MPSAATITYSNRKIEPYIRPDKAVSVMVQLAASTNYARGQVLGEKLGTNSIQRIAISGVPTAGNFTVTKDAVPTANIAFGASNEVITAALEADASFGPGNVRVTGGWNDLGGTWDVEFIGGRAGAAQTAITVQVGGLTGGTPAVAITQVQVGAAGTAGVFGKYAETNADGTGVAKAVLPYDCQTDASGNITLSSTAGQSGGEWGQTQQAIDVYVEGYFACADLVGLDAKAVRDLGKIVKGSTATGMLHIR